MSDTDPEMMRRQQALDTGRPLDPDETQAAPGLPDADAESRRAREAAKAGTAAYADGQQDAIFKENKVFEEPNALEVEGPNSTDPDASLVQPGRSRLKR